MDDVTVLTDLNARFIDSFRQGSWAMLKPILSPGFSYMDGKTGEVWSMDRYIENMDGKPAPTIAFDQVMVHVDGDTAVVSARTSVRPERHTRYADTYHRTEDGWQCVHACLWSVPEAAAS